MYMSVQKKIFQEEELIEMIRLFMKDCDPELWNHCRRTAYLGKYIATSLGLSDSDVDLVFKASLVHDAGKLFIDPKILLKPGKLNEEEREVIDTHSVLGYIYLKSLGFSEDVCLMVLLHHGYNKEKFNVEYSEGHILCADIIRACDIFDAVTHKRSYHDARTSDVAMRIIKEQKEEIPPKVVEVLKGI